VGLEWQKMPHFQHFGRMTSYSQVGGQSDLRYRIADHSSIAALGALFRCRRIKLDCNAQVLPIFKALHGPNPK